MTAWTLEFRDSINQIEAVEWDAVAGQDNPFVSHAFLSALEHSECVGPRTGWLPLPATLRNESGELLATAPSYIKLNSKGEYMFDYHWAEAFHRIVPGKAYYPKLQVAVPFTPVPGPRILCSKTLSPQEQGKLRQAMVEGFKSLVEKEKVSSIHITFCEPEERVSAQSHSDYLSRVGEQYHWFNYDYESFDHFLSTLTSRKRKNIRKERNKAHSHGLKFHTIHGNELTESQCLNFFRMYESTCMRKWGQPYLNLNFFKEIAKKLGPRLVIFLVQDKDDQWIAGAWNLRGSETLFGRNWGCLLFYDCLHFEVCYYQAIEYAIEHGLKKVEAGAQGMHKIQRGYQPRAVHSAHFFPPGDFREAIRQYVDSERLETEFRLEALTQLEPFKKVSPQNV